MSIKRDITIEDFGKKLQIAMLERDMTQKELAEKSGLSTNTIYSVVNMKRLPGSKALSEICKTLGVSREYFLGDEPDPIAAERQIKEQLERLFEIEEDMEKRFSPGIFGAAAQCEKYIQNLKRVLSSLFDELNYPRLTKEDEEKVFERIKECIKLIVKAEKVYKAFTIQIEKNFNEYQRENGITPEAEHLIQFDWMDKILEQGEEVFNTMVLKK